MALSDPITSIAGLGEQSARKLAKFGIYRLIDFLFHLPIRYQDKTKITKIDDLIAGQHFLIQGRIQFVEKRTHPRKQLWCEIDDGSQQKLIVRFFHWFDTQAIHLKRAHIIQCYGEVNQREHWEIIHPQYRIIDLKQTPLLSENLSPIYANTTGIAPYKLTQWIKTALTQLENSPLTDILMVCQSGMPDINQAIQTLHYPTINELPNINQNKERLILDELCAKQLALLQVKKQQQSQQSPQYPISENLNNQLSKNLGFTLTNAQKKAIKRIQNDLTKPIPMMRLLQGDVGCGKTIVAIFATLGVISNQAQVVLMVPTEILAKQHLANFEKQLSPLGFNCLLFIGGQPAKLRQENLSQCKRGYAHVIIGTHALFQEGVEFHQLGLVIIDEQHKFGVHQRLLLNQKSVTPTHQLIMTATPIPRSLTMSLYADLDTTIIDELPPNRQNITTITASLVQQEKIIQKITQVIASGHQVYWVCRLIDESEKLPIQSAINRFNALKEALPNQKISLIHGRLNRQEKAEIMQQFSLGHIDILVATTVIEVGVDVANANLIIIEDAHRMGLAQLHQLRGRIGRSQHASLCILLYQSPLSQAAKQRLSILKHSQDGFVIAQKDLEIRGPGELLGAAQTGLTSFKIANLTQDNELLERSYTITACLFKQDITQQNNLINRWYHIPPTDYGTT